MPSVMILKITMQEEDKIDHSNDKCQVLATKPESLWGLESLG